MHGLFAVTIEAQRLQVASLVITSDAVDVMRMKQAPMGRIRQVHAALRADEAGLLPDTSGDFRPVGSVVFLAFCMLVRHTARHVSEVGRIGFKKLGDIKGQPDGRIVFTPSKGLVDVGLPRNARRSDADNGIFYGLDSVERSESGVALGWNDVKDLKAGETISKTFTDTTRREGPVERTIVYQAPFFRPDREQDYALAWAFFSSGATQ